MDRTTANDFRANLKEWMETTRSEPVKITRKSGEAFILLNADEFEKMKLDLARFKGLTSSLMDATQGRVKSASAQSTRGALSRAKSRALASKRSKKASGER